MTTYEIMWIIGANGPVVLLALVGGMVGDALLATPTRRVVVVDVEGQAEAYRRAA